MNKIYKQLMMAGLAVSVLAGVAQQGDRSALAQADADLKTQLSATPEVLEAGKNLFQAQCSSCHGNEGRGDGLAAAALNPKPRNFHSTSEWVNGMQFTGLFKTLDEGINGGKTGMNAYSHLSVKDRVALIQYIRSLESNLYPEPSDAELQQLETDYELTKALSQDTKVLPIPVNLAISKLVEESAGKRNKIAQNAEKALQATDANAHLFQRVAYDLPRALTVLTHADSAWQSSLDDFVRLVSADLGQNGFGTPVNSLSSTEWQSLHTYLKGMI